MYLFLHNKKSRTFLSGAQQIFSNYILIQMKQNKFVNGILNTDFHNFTIKENFQKELG